MKNFRNAGTAAGSGILALLVLAGSAGAQGGQILWNANYPDVVATPAIGGDGTVYLGTPDYGPGWGFVPGSVLALDGKTGAVKWKSSMDNSAGMVALGTNGYVYVGDAGTLRALEGSTGARLWQSSGPQWNLSAPAIGADGTVYVCGGYGEHRAYALDGTTGAAKWDYLLGTVSGDPFFASRTISSPAIGPDGTVYVGSVDGTIAALDPTTGTW